MSINRIIHVSYSRPQTMYLIPKDLPLLSVVENEKLLRVGTCVPFSWWIKWDRFHYYDKDGKEQILEKYKETDIDCKYPQSVIEYEELG